jgi:PAB-dependent poly(A)-specific ribonuclease subunit 3
MNLHQAALASFFISPSLREDLQKRAECLNPSNEGTDIPGYFSIVPLDSPSVPAPTKDAASNVPQAGLGIFGIRNWVYKAFSEKDGKPYVLRRLEGFRLTSRNEGAMIAFVEKWRKLRHPSLVSVVEAFTTKAFGDSCGSRSAPNFRR